VRELRSGTHWIVTVEIRRRLPHQYSEGKWLFVTFHLHGSLPHARYPPAGKLSAGAAFVWMDRYLDTTRTGPMYLADARVARVVIDALHRGEALGHFELGAYVAMANHVHLLVLPKVPASRLMRSLKGATAREANLILGRTGESLWQAESYDRWMRNGAEWELV
jgi:REP element-mobilizing transposase RayT